MKRTTKAEFVPDEYRELLQTHKHRTGLTWGDIARRSGIPQSAVIAFAHNRSGLNDDDISKLRNYVHHNVFLGDDIIPTLTHQSLTKYFQDAFLSQSFYVVTGKSGFGKTATAKHFARVNERAYWVNGTVDMGPRDVLLELMRVSGLPIPPKGATKYVLQQTVSEHLAGSASLIVVDEADKLSVKALDTLREIYDYERVVCGIVLLGEPGLTSKLRSTDKSGLSLMRLYSRVNQVVTVDKIVPEDIKLFLKEYGITSMPTTAFTHIVERIDRRGGYRYLKMIAENIIGALQPSDEQRTVGEVPLAVVKDVLAKLPL